MKRTFWIPLAAIAALLAGFYWLSDHDDRPELDYRERVIRHRAEIDYFMRNSEGSPFAGRVSEFQRLEYFPIDESFRVNAVFSPVTTLSSIELSTSDGKTRSYFLYGTLSFQLEGNSRSLSVYRGLEDETDELFLGFMDATSAVETYGAGRYLNIEIEEDQAVLDFNLAYNPYCAYNEDFVCPFPPRENILDIAVRAGEKDYKKQP